MWLRFTHARMPTEQLFEPVNSDDALFVHCIRVKPPQCGERFVAHACRQLSVVSRDTLLVHVTYLVSFDHYVLPFSRV